ncbi:MAG: hypothetical protein DMG75_14725 [Acidobacteria bacterium]|nr:MAG: hypothetical protein DMG75_14725 [Acidobacteriota bacterium]
MIAGWLVLGATMGLAQPRPKVTFTTRRTATIKNLVPRVNCLIGGTDITKADNADKPCRKPTLLTQKGCQQQESRPTGQKIRG